MAGLKQRPTVPLTYEDSCIWDRLMERDTPWCWSTLLSALAADRHDADVMWRYEQAKALLIAEQGTATYLEVRFMAVTIALEAQR